MPYKAPKMTDHERMLGYTHEQREAALREPHMQYPSPWMKVMSDPFPYKSHDERARANGSRKSS